MTYKWTPDELEQLYKDNPDLARLNGSAQDNEAKPSLAHPGVPQASKYRAQRTEYGGVTYHSKKEAAKAAELDLLVKSGEISFYLRQVPFGLGGNPHITYRADFVTFQKVRGVGEAEVLENKVLTWRPWFITVIEVKGMWTGEAKLKLKLFRAKYPGLKLVVE